MNSVVLAIAAIVCYLLAYRFYGRFLAAKIFGIDPTRTTPAHALRDDRDYMPAHREVLFGHHFTSIAGTGPIVGPAIGVIWGWVPAFVWVVLGPIFMGAVHDLGALVLSIRNEGRSIGDVAGETISPRIRMAFMFVIFLLLLIVIAVFGLVIGTIFNLYGQAVFPFWISIPIAMGVGWAIYRKGVGPWPASLVGLALLLIAIGVGVTVPIHMPSVLLSVQQQTGVYLSGIDGVSVSGLAFADLPAATQAMLNGYGAFAWVVLLLVYAYVASVLPVWRLLQPRDFINGHQLFVLLGLMLVGVAVLHPTISAPAFRAHPTGAPPFVPFLFITIACGAISGFHCLVSSGTSGKQLNNERDALPIAYGGMLLEGLLAVVVLISVAAALGDTAVWNSHYASWSAAAGLRPKLQAFVDGAANLLTALVPAGLVATAGAKALVLGVAKGAIGVLVATFAGTTMDTATRLQRYIVAEMAGSMGIRPLATRHGATTFAVLTAAMLAFLPVEGMGPGSGGLTLWPLFGATNQLLGGLALLVITVYLIRRGISSLYTAVPMIVMLILTGWAMVYNLGDEIAKEHWHLVAIGGVVLVLDAWMIAEAFIVVRQTRKEAAAAAVDAG